MNLPTWMMRTPASVALHNNLTAGFATGLVTLFIGLASPASAGLVLDIGPEMTIVAQPTAGTTTSVTLTAFLRADVGTESVENYSVPIDLSPPDRAGSPVGMTLNSATARTVFPDQTLISSPLVDPGGDADFLISIIPPFVFPPPPLEPVVFGTSPTPLFDFTITIDSTVALGDYSVAAVKGGLFGFAPGLTDNVQFGTTAVIRVVAVPEPSTLSVLGLLVVPTVLRRRRRSV